MKKLLKLDSFWLRLIAIIAMTVDHVGAMLSFSDFYFLRIIGRLAFPIFAFLTAEGALKTSHKGKYILRMSILLVIVAIALGLLAFIPSPYQQIGLSGNIFVDLLLIILSITILESDNKKIKPLIILPILYSIYCYVVTKLEGCGCDGTYYWFFPPLRMQGGYFSLFLGLGFYAAKKYAPIFIKNRAPMHVDDPEYEQLVSNIMSVIVLIFLSIIFMLTNYSFGDKYYNEIDSIQTYFALAGVFILLYNGKKGYNAMWFKVAYYLYYPVHIVIIALVFYLFL